MSVLVRCTAEVDPGDVLPEIDLDDLTAELCSRFGQDGPTFDKLANALAYALRRSASRAT
jgi:hypothetical protein